MLRPSLFCVILVLSACGGRSPAPSQPIVSPPPLPVAGAPAQFATGPIGTACLVHRRPGATRERCGCIQAAANQTLSPSQQQRSVRFFSEPGLLQDIRQSDNPANRTFWETWNRFADTAETFCGGL
ncbi:hypothetical protein [Roseobacter sinensis]|uniref:Arginine transporter n=1 Tax=Roseobacter sinensis TaxID=2931391 RepID=A0ABT3BL98_9RHOB|nr:hypothetical protein [Roseobacter sp. WL0113]MCV3274350.1 hypothetical protein [Roseobacter sp. WL0113]